ncbi:MAG: thiol-disulfide oxidoreductase [Chryseobacterium sp. 39-10]|nr:DUF393 domain-containing protein [Chryseobacterium sp.]OJV49323.1 MAG: thiol-disulfide oxidoreductase [Chryseobacterium sp. 39-10]
MNDLDASKYYIFYDGQCGFCNHWVKWILKNDKKERFLFSAIQSEFGQRFLKDRNLPTQSLKTLYLWKPGSYFLTKSQAVFAIGRILGGVNAVFGHFNFLPTIMTDFLYDQVSNNRLKFSSQKCMVPDEDQRKRFVEK